MDPPARNSMWRLGFSNPVNYNDNEVFCGGVGVQAANGFKCGVCGDNFDKKPPRLHEGGGKYGNGIIGRRYAMGQNITVDIELTTNHWGFFELKLCPLNNRAKVATQACMDKNPLPLAANGDLKFYVPIGTAKQGNFSYQVALPQGLTCQQCVVQWTYTTGNTWGKCKNGTEAIGCGPQETFRNCADIQIFSNAPTGGFFLGDTDGLEFEFPSAIYIVEKSRDGVAKRRFPFVVRHQVCVPTPTYKNDSHMAEWCQTNCLRYPPNCPEDKCTCPTSCRAIGRLAGVEGTDVYCHRNCLRYPPTCPEDECQCDVTSANDVTGVTSDQELQSSIVQATSSEELQTQIQEEPYDVIDDNDIVIVGARGAAIGVQEPAIIEL